MVEEQIRNIRTGIYQELDREPDMTEEQLEERITDMIKQSKLAMSVREKETVSTEVFNSIRKMDILQELLEDDTVTEIMINGYSSIFVERNGKIFRWNKYFESTQRLEDVAQRIAALSNRIVNESVPIMDTRLSDGSRVNIVLPPVAIDGPVVTIRKFYNTPITVERLIELGSVSEEAAQFLEKAVRAGYNIFISGGTGSGKTTFLNALSNYIPKDERIITIEDSAELQITNAENLVRLEARNMNVEGKNEVTIRDLIKSSLRMRPDRIIVGEVRGAEAIDMLQAMNTGHDGSLSTGHSNSPSDMLSRLETMVLMGMDMPIAAIRQQIASAIDIIVHLGRLRDKSRHVLAIEEVGDVLGGQIQLHRLFEFKERGEDECGRVLGELERVFDTLDNNYKMAAAGIISY
ncbi:MAG: CpaF family protein [Lachnospira sp.]|nr:CpaF family protein [Lachnospira sp.]